MWHAPMRCLLATLMSTGTIICAPPASADPNDWVPWCTGYETPMDTNCRANSTDGVDDSAPGANPDVPLGIDPGQNPFVGTG